MDEKLQYASMIEMPVNTCTVVHKPLKKKKRKKENPKNPEIVKQQLLDKINAEEQTENTPITQENEYVKEDTNEGLSVEVYKKGSRKKDKKNRKISIIGVQLAIIGVLVAGIFLTNAFYAGSGLNVFLKSVFGPTSQTSITDDRVYGEFSPVLSLTDGVEMVLTDGVMTLSGEGSVYVSCDGKITALTKDDAGKFTMEITHSDNFKSILSGLDYAYAGLLDQVYHNIPVGFVDGQIEMCFTRGDGTIIADYEIIDNSVVWAV